MVSKTDWSPPPQSLVSTQLDVWRLMEVVLVRAHICHGHHGLYSWRKNCHYAVLLLNLLFKLFCRKIFATIYALSCGEKLIPKVNLWRKNDKYQV